MVTKVKNKKVLDFFEKETSGISFKSNKYCFEHIRVPSIIYDESDNISFKRYGETVHYKSYINLIDKSKQIRTSEALFKYFVDGSRRTYKVDDIAYDKRIYPIVAGQIGIGCCKRPDPSSMKKKELITKLVLSVPSDADKDRRGEVFYLRLCDKLNESFICQKRNVIFDEILVYDGQSDKGSYENLAIAKIQNRMVDLEKRMVLSLARENFLNENSYLLKDGSLEYATVKNKGNKDFKLSILKNNFRWVVGASKSFNPELCLDIKGKSNATNIAKLPLYHRTPAFMYETKRVDGVKFSIWYIRIRDAVHSASPFDGVLKIEKILITEKEQEEGIDSEEADLITANIINERNPVCYGSDKRWANHLYPIYITENYIKSRYLSDVYYLNIF